MLSQKIELIGTNTFATSTNFYNHYCGLREYEMTNHLGNVLTVVSDKKIPRDMGGDDYIENFEADVISATDYSPFGAPLYGRTFSSSRYRYGFNGKEKDDEVKNAGNHLDYGMRVQDTRLGRFLSVDPLFRKFPMLTDYQFASNTPIQAIDIDGKEAGASVSTLIFGAANITTVTADNVVRNFESATQKFAKLSRDGLIISGGVIATIASGGTLGIVMGVVATGGGVTKAVLDFKGDYDASESVPTTITGTVLVTANYISNGQVFSKSFIATAEITEGVLNLDLSKLYSEKPIEQADAAMQLINLSLDLTTLPDNAKKMIEESKHQNVSNQNVPVNDNTTVAPKVIAPNIKVVEKSSTKPAKSNGKSILKPVTPDQSSQSPSPTQQKSTPASTSNAQSNTVNTPEKK